MPVSKHFTQGKQYWEQGKYKEAIIELHIALQEDSTYMPTYYYLGKSLLSLKSFHPAKHYFQKLIDSQSEAQSEAGQKTSDYYDSLAMCEQHLGEHELANQHYDLALSHDSKNQSALHNKALLGLILAEQIEHHTEAYTHLKTKSIELLTELLAYNNTHEYAWNTKARWFELDEKYDEATQFYLKAKQYCPESDSQLRQIISTNLAQCAAQAGHIYYKAGDYSSAIQYYRIALQEDKTVTPALYHLGWSYYFSKLYDEAQTQFTTLYEIETKPEDKADALVGRAACFRERQKYLPAEQDLQLAKQLSPEDETVTQELDKLKPALDKLKTASTVIWRFWQKTSHRDAPTTTNSHMAQP